MCVWIIVLQQGGIFFVSETVSIPLLTTQLFPLFSIFCVIFTVVCVYSGRCFPMLFIEKKVLLLVVCTSLKKQYFNKTKLGKDTCFPHVKVRVHFLFDRL